MAEKFTQTLTFTRRGKDSDNGKWASFLEPKASKWCRIRIEYVDKITVGEAADVEYAVTDQGGVFINKVNGVDVSRAPKGMAGGGGGPLGASKPSAGPLGASAGAKSGGSGYEGAWASMGPENRARMVADAFVRGMYKGTGQHPGKEALANDFRLTYEAWLQGCEGRNPHAGGIGNGAGDFNEDPPDYGDDPGASSEADYA